MNTPVARESEDNLRTHKCRVFHLDFSAIAVRASVGAEFCQVVAVLPCWDQSRKWAGDVAPNTREPFAPSRRTRASHHFFERGAVAAVYLRLAGQSARVTQVRL